MKPLKIASKRCPETIFAASLRPNDTALDKYEINSIKTRRGSKARGVPAGTKREKNSTPCFWKPRIVAPRTILKLKEKARIKCEVDAKLYGQLDKPFVFYRIGLYLNHPGFFLEKNDLSRLVSEDPTKLTSLVSCWLLIVSSLELLRHYRIRILDIRGFQRIVKFYTVISIYGLSWT